MKPEEFMSASFGDLASLTKIDRHRWCRYLNGKVPPNYKTIKKASEKLGMTTITLLDCIEKRIEIGKQENSCA
jgi:transcriptional regulator with XRE-family HTH domain